MQQNAFKIVPGSLSAIAQSAQTSIATAFMGCDAVVLLDTSGSMEAADAPGNISRHEAADRQLRRLHQRYPGKLALVVFSDRPVFCPGGVPERLNGGTNLTEALRYIHIADDTGMKLILISDGWPDSPAEAMAEARKFTTPISTIYIGPESDDDGRRFLSELAATTGGIHQDGDAPGVLENEVLLLMEMT